MNLKKIALVATAVSMVAIAGATVYAAGSDPEKFQYFVEALKWGLEGLKEYFNFIIELFKIATGC